MKKNDFILKIYSLSQTVYSTKEIGLLFTDISYNNIKARLNYFVRTKKLLNPARGLYTKKDFNKLELATKIYTPSYISLETILAKVGVVFQTYDSIFAMSYVNRQIRLKDKTIVIFKRLKSQILTSKLGIDKERDYFVASPERALIDAVYIYKDYHFDNLSPINWERVFEIAPIYKSKILLKRLESYYKFAKDNV